MMMIARMVSFPNPSWAAVAVSARLTRRWGDAATVFRSIFTTNRFKASIWVSSQVRAVFRQTRKFVAFRIQFYDQVNETHFSLSLYSVGRNIHGKMNGNEWKSANIGVSLFCSSARYLRPTSSSVLCFLLQILPICPAKAVVRSRKKVRKTSKLKSKIYIRESWTGRREKNSTWNFLFFLFLSSSSERSRLSALGYVASVRSKPTFETIVGTN